MWMQDKPLVQEELATNISGLLDYFQTTEQSLLYMDVFFESMAREWYLIDRWRMDKFMMFVRHFLRNYLLWLSRKNWPNDLISQTFQTWKNFVLNPREDVADGLKYHFAAIYLDEMDFAGASTLSEDKVVEFLKPFISLLMGKINDYFFDSIVKEVFETILLQFSQELEENQLNGEEEEANAEKQPKLKIPYGRLADELFLAGKKPKLKQNRRKIIYDLVKKFRWASEGNNPLDDYLSSGSDLDESEIEDAATRLISENEEIKKRKRSKVHQEEPKIEEQRKKKKIKRVVDVKKMTKEKKSESLKTNSVKPNKVKKLRT